MTKAELQLAEAQLTQEYNLNLYRLRKAFVDANTEFKVGDFIWNVTGIIKIDKIDYRMFMGSVEIVYSGLRYKKAKGVLSRTKDRSPSTLVYSLKLIENPIVE